MNITWIRTNTNAVGQYRAAHPVTALQRLGHTVRLLTVNEEGSRTANAELAGDVLVLGRVTSDTCFKLIETLPAQLRPKVIYELDDNPWEWHSYDPAHKSLGRNYAKLATAIMKRCDGIIASTPTLARRVMAEVPGKPVFVVPNAIDLTIRDWDIHLKREDFSIPADAKVIGWTGSVHHLEDHHAAMLGVAQVMQWRDDAVFLAQCDEPIADRISASLHAAGFRNRCYWVPPVPFEFHPAVYSLFDVNLAPLQRTKFNTCKSDLRLIEGGAQGVPYVATDIAPYREFHRDSDGVGGWLATTGAEWADGIDEALEDRATHGGSLQQYVRSRRSLEVSAGQWQTALEQTVNGARASDVIATEEANGRNSPCPCGSGRKSKRCCGRAYV